MARGWESKEVESQIEAAEERALQKQRAQLTAKQDQHQRETESLELSRTRVLHDIETAQNPKYRAVLEQSLAFLDGKLAALKQSEERSEHQEGHPGQGS